MQDRFTVPTLPDLALLFDAHTNFVKVVPSDFAEYLLKYTCKFPPGGPLAFTIDELLDLGIPSQQEYERLTNACLAQHTVYTAADLALQARGEEVFAMDCTVEYVEVLPRQRCRYTIGPYQMTEPQPHAMDRYVASPILGSHDS